MWGFLLGSNTTKVNDEEKTQVLHQVLPLLRQEVYGKSTWPKERCRQPEGTLKGAALWME